MKKTKCLVVLGGVLLLGVGIVISNGYVLTGGLVLLFLAFYMPKGQKLNAMEVSSVAGMIALHHPMSDCSNDGGAGGDGGGGG